MLVTCVVDDSVQPHKTVALQAPLSMGFSRQEYWSELPCPPPGHLPDPGIKPMSLKSPALAGRFFAISATWKAYLGILFILRVISRSGIYGSKRSCT